MGSAFVGQGGLVDEAVVVCRINGLVVEGHRLGMLAREGGDFSRDEGVLMLEVFRADVSPYL